MKTKILNYLRRVLGITALQKCLSEVNFQIQRVEGRLDYDHSLGCRPGVPPHWQGSSTALPPAVDEGTMGPGYGPVEIVRCVECGRKLARIDSWEAVVTKPGTRNVQIRHPLCQPCFLHITKGPRLD